MFIDDKLSFDHKTKISRKGHHILFILHKLSLVCGQYWLYDSSFAHVLMNLFFFPSVSYSWWNKRTQMTSSISTPQLWRQQCSCHIIPWAVLHTQLSVNRPKVKCRNVLPAYLFSHPFNVGVIISLYSPKMCLSWHYCSDIPVVHIHYINCTCCDKKQPL